MEFKKLKDMTLAEVAWAGMNYGGEEFLTLVRAANKVGEGHGYSREELRDMSMEEIFNLEEGPDAS
jgi:hypothetical protein